MHCSKSLKLTRLSQFIQELSVWRASGGLLQDSFCRTARRYAPRLNRDKKETLGKWEGRTSKLCVQGAAEDGGIQEEYHTEDVTEYCLHCVSHCAYSLIRASQCDFVPTQRLTLIWLWHVPQCASLFAYLVGSLGSEQHSPSLANMGSIKWCVF